MKRKAEISISNKQNNANVETILLGKYTLESIGNALVKILSEGRGFKFTMNHLKARVAILNPYKQKVKLDRDLSSLFGIDHRLQEKNPISRFTSFDAYLVHCDLLDKDENL